MTINIERGTRTVVTPNNHNVIVYDYITGGEMRRLNALYMENLKAGDVMKTGVNVKDMMGELPVSILLKAQEMALEMLIVSVDGCEKKDAYEAAMNMKEADLDFLINEIDQITSGLKKNNESESSQNT